MTPALRDIPLGQVDHRAEHAAKLGRMACQIAEAFKAYPEEKAVASIADHINQFWTGHMREDFLAAFRPCPDSLPPRLRQALPLIHRTTAAGTEPA